MYNDKLSVVYVRSNAFVEIFSMMDDGGKRRLNVFTHIPLKRLHNDPLSLDCVYKMLVPQC